MPYPPLVTMADIAQVIPGLVEHDNIYSWIRSCSDAVHNFCNRKSFILSNNTFRCHGNNCASIWLPETPIQSVTLMTIDGSAVLDAAYIIEPDNGEIEFIDSLPIRPRQRVYVEYQGGYDSVPWVIKECVISLIKHNFQLMSQSDATSPTDTTQSSEIPSGIPLSTVKKYDLRDWSIEFDPGSNPMSRLYSKNKSEGTSFVAIPQDIQFKLYSGGYVVQDVIGA